MKEMCCVKYQGKGDKRRDKVTLSFCLGWLYHTLPGLAGTGENSHSKAIELLKLAVGANHTCGQAWYFLGRCHADRGHFKEAFMAYRQSVEKMENQPDTWCAIG